MARVAGKKGTINEGAIGDLPVDEGVAVHDGTQPWHDQVENQGLEVLDPKDDPGSTPLQLAQAMIRGDDLSHPVQAELAEEIAGREHAVDANADADAEAGSDVREDVEERASSKLNRAPFDPGEDYTLAGVSERNREAVGAGGSKPKAEAPKPAASSSGEQKPK